jgi:hypothetical protein
MEMKFSSKIITMMMAMLALAMMFAGCVPGLCGHAAADEIGGNNCSYNGKTPEYGLERIQQWKPLGIAVAQCGPFYICQNPDTGQIGYVHDCTYGGKKAQFGYTTEDTSENWVHEGGGVYRYIDDPAFSTELRDFLMQFAPKRKKRQPLGTSVFLQCPLSRHPGVQAQTRRASGYALVS